MSQICPALRRTLAGTAMLLALASPAFAEPISPQPTVPPSPQDSLPMNSPILGGGSTEKAGSITVRKAARRMPGHAHHAAMARRRKLARDRRPDAEPIDRPALAGVALLQPIPHPIQPPHATVPVPAYPFENVATFYTSPPPSVVCHHARRDPDAPQAGLAYEQPVICAADNP